VCDCASECASVCESERVSVFVCISEFVRVSE
jgi:hypothetical protein